MVPRRFLPGSALALILLVGCVEPGLAPERVLALKAGLLAFIRDGHTTRQEVLLRLGTPTSTFEGGRILSYDFVLDGKGEWRRVGTIMVSEWQYPLPQDSSLVLVFDPDGVLTRHSLLMEERKVAPPTKAPVPD